MELVDYVSEEDMQTLQEWIEINQSCTIPDMRAVLKYWNKNKRTMFKLLGKQLRYKVPFEIEMDKHLYYRQLNEIYEAPHIKYYDKNDTKPKLEERAGHPFIDSFFDYIFNFPMEVEDGCRKNLNCPFYIHWESPIFTFQTKHYSNQGYNVFTYNLPTLFSHITIGQGHIVEDYVCTYKDKKPLVLPAGMKIMRAIQKLVYYIEYPYLDLFDMWRTDLSSLSSQTRIKANLVLSVHPLDFLTLSDNNCGWRSCVNFQNKGLYSNSLTEMMNSNCVIVAYFESTHKKFTFNYREIPNKSWRQLFYCHKDIIVGGKSYPYGSNDISQAVLKIIQDLAAKNLEWKYQFGPQLYKDMKYIDYENSYTGKEQEPHDHQIKLYTYGYYNDFAADDSFNYWCVRNKVKEGGKRICISGPATCLVCGEKIYKNNRYEWLWEEDVDGINESYAGVLCNDCCLYKCNTCGRLDITAELYNVPTVYSYNITVCKDCLRAEWLVRQLSDGSHEFIQKKLYLSTEYYRQYDFQPIELEKGVYEQYRIRRNLSDSGSF